MTTASLARPHPGIALGQIYRYRELVGMLVARDLKVRYKRSVLGMLWSLLNPLLQMAVYSFVSFEEVNWGGLTAAATVIDGHAMARKGEAGRAFGAGFMASLSGGTPRRTSEPSRPRAVR